MAQHETAQQPTELEHLTLRVNDLEAKLAARTPKTRMSPVTNPARVRRPGGGTRLRGRPPPGQAASGRESAAPRGGASGVTRSRPAPTQPGRSWGPPASRASTGTRASSAANIATNYGRRRVTSPGPGPALPAAGSPGVRDMATFTRMACTRIEGGMGFDPKKPVDGFVAYAPAVANFVGLSQNSFCQLSPTTSPVAGQTARPYVWLPSRHGPA